MTSKRTILVIVLAVEVVVAVNVAAWWWLRSPKSPDATAPEVAPSPPDPAAPRAAVEPSGAAHPGEPGVVPRADLPPPPQHDQLLDAPQKAVDPARGGPPVPTSAGMKKWELIPPERAKANPDDLSVNAPLDEAALAKLQERMRSEHYCTSAAEAKLSTREFVVRQRGTSGLGKPSAVASRIWYGGFTVVIHTVKSSGRKVAVDDEARRAAVAKGVCTWALPLVVVPTSVGAFEKAPDLEVYLPVVSSEKIVPPLKSGRVEEGLAYVGKPTLSAGAGPDAIAAFLAEVRASGAVPRGPLLSRLDDQGTYSRDDDTMQFIQPITAP